MIFHQIVSGAMSRWVNIDNVTHIDALDNGDGTYIATYHVTSGESLVTYCLDHDALIKVVNFTLKDE